MPFCEVVFFFSTHGSTACTWKSGACSSPGCLRPRVHGQCLQGGILGAATSAMRPLLCPSPTHAGPSRHPTQCWHRVCHLDLTTEQDGAAGERGDTPRATRCCWCPQLCLPMPAAVTWAARQSVLVPWEKLPETGKNT